MLMNRFLLYSIFNYTMNHTKEHVELRKNIFKVVYFDFKASKPLTSKRSLRRPKISDTS